VGKEEERDFWAAAAGYRCWQAGKGKGKKQRVQLMDRAAEYLYR
jgi:hypothetical protein